MRTDNIIINYDARKLEALAQNYEGTLEGFIEYELDNLYEEVVPPELAHKIKTDQDIESRDNSKNRFGLIMLKDDDDEVYITSFESKSFVDVAKIFAEYVYTDMERYDMMSLKNYFGDTDVINEPAFDIMSAACGKDDRIGVVAKFDIGEGVIDIKTHDNPDWRSFEIEYFYRASSALLNDDNKYYMDDIEHLEQYIKKFNAELTELEVRTSSDMDTQQM